MTTPLDPAAVVESDLEDFDRLKDLILTLLPYAIEDGEDPPNEANAEECVEYAADEIKRLRAENERLRMKRSVWIVTSSGCVHDDNDGGVEGVFQTREDAMLLIERLRRRRSAYVGTSWLKEWEVKP